jgi:hypothetical protein
LGIGILVFACNWGCYTSLEIERTSKCCSGLLPFLAYSTRSFWVAPHSLKKLVTSLMQSLGFSLFLSSAGLRFLVPNLLIPYWARDLDFGCQSRDFVFSHRTRDSNFDAKIELGLLVQRAGVEFWVPNLGLGLFASSMRLKFWD